MADDSAEIDPGLLENVQLAIRNNIELNFVKKVKIEFKGERVEARILALSAHRLYVLTSSRNGCKVESSMHILEIQKIESSKPLLLTILCGDKPLYIRLLQSKDCTEVIAHIVASLKTNFPSGNPDRLLRLMFGPPEESDERQAQVTTLINNLRNTEGDLEMGPCGGFSKVYVSMCDFYGQPHLEEVVWDIDTIYLSLNTKELNIQDFDHLDPKDLVPLISTLEYNDWFTKLTCDSFKLGSEVCDAIIRVVKKSSTIEELALDGVSFGRDYCQKLALSLTSNPKTSLHSFSLTGNSIEDRGVTHLSGALGKLPHGLVSLSLADNGITSKGASTLGQALKSNKYNDSSLKRLDLSKNPLKGDGVASLCDFFSKPNMLTHLDLSSTECPLDLLFGALIRGSAQHLATINLAGNSFTSKKTKDYVVPPSFKQFFSSSQALKSLDVSDCKLQADAIRAIFEGLRENHVLTAVELNVSKNDLRGPGAKAIAENIANLKSIARLDISDNGFEMDLIKILDKLAPNKSLKHLNLGQNSRQRSSAAVMEALVQLISFENSQLESISLADSRLKQDIIPLLDALGTNETLKELDISGNQMGDEGARILAKALQINTKLRTLHWDRNSTTFKGFADIAGALECNHILLSMPMPLYDAAQSLKPQTEQHIRQIEKLLLRNQSPHKVVTEQAYRLQQGLLLTSTQQQMADRLVVQLQDLMSGLRVSKDPDVKKEVKTAKHFVQDADKLKQLLLKFHLCTNDTDIEARFAELAADFYQAAQDKMKSNMDKMIECAKEVCPNITTSEDVTGRLQSVVQDKSRLSETFVEEIVLTQAAAGIANRLSEDKLTVASIMADTIMEMVIHQLEDSVSKLELLLKDQQDKTDHDEKDVEKSVEEDDVASEARKARNRLSSVQLAVPMTDGTDGATGGGRSHRRRPTVNRRPSPSSSIPEESESGIKEEVQSTDAVVVSKTPSKSAVGVDFTDIEPKASELKHLVKGRARPPAKRRLPTRPSNRPAVANGSAHDEGTQQESIEVFWSAPAAESEVPTPTKTPSKTPKTKSPAPTTTPPVKTAPPRPATKPKPSPKARDNEESKKSWMPKGGINIVPGFLKKKAHRDRAHTGPEAAEEQPPKRKTSGSAWYTLNEKETKKTPEKPEVVTPQEKAESPKIRVTSEEKSKVLKERAPSEKKPEVSKETAPSDKSPDLSREKAPSVTKQERVQSGSKERSPSEIKRERAPSGNKKEVAKTAPSGGLKPFMLSRDRATTGSIPKPTSPTPRDRAASADVPLSNPASKEPVKPHGPPKFGIGIGGAAGGGLLAEMKMRQEKAASLGRGKTAEKAPEAKKDDGDGVLRPRLPSGGKEAVSEGLVKPSEGLVKPAPYKRPRLPSGPPPKPAPRPDRKDSKKVEKEEEKEVKKEVKVEEKKEKREEKGEGKEGVQEEKTKEAKEKPQEKVKVEAKEESSITKQEEQNKKVKEEQKKEIPVVVQEEQKEEKKEDNHKVETTKKEEVNEVKEQLEDRKNAEEQENVDGKRGEAVSETALVKEQETMDDLWIKRPSGKESLRPAGRSQSVNIKRSSSSSDKGSALRSATLPKPWSPGQAPSSTLSRKLSWEMPKRKEEERKKERSGSKGEAAIQEDPEDQTSETSTTTTTFGESVEKEEIKLDSHAEAQNGEIKTKPDGDDSVFALLETLADKSETQL